MKIYNFEFTTRIDFDLPIINHNFILKCIPGNYVCQRIYNTEFTLEPESQYTIGKDSFGNNTVNGNLMREHNSFLFSIKGTASLSKYRIMEDLDRVYLYPSKQTNPSKSMSDFFENLSIPENTVDAVKYISDKVFEHMTYVKNSTTVNTTAAEAFEQKTGVCQDYAHITIALLRLAKIPARYVAGFIEGDGETHAWVEYYSDGSWYGIDPTNQYMIDYGYIKLSQGRDSDDCSVERGCFSSNEGLVNQTSNIIVKVGEIL